MKKKTIAILVIVLVLVSTMRAFAFEKDSIGIDQKVSMISSELLSSIEPEKDLYGLEDVDFSTLSLGNPIPTYVLREEGLVEEKDMLYYPILCGNEWVATATVFNMSNEIPNVQISTAYAGNNVVQDSVALLFDQKGAYLINNDKALMVESAAVIDDEKLTLDDYKGNLRVPTSQIQKKMHLEVNSVVKARAYESSHYLSVPLITQAANSKQCWAACIASIRGYYGTPTTIDDVYNFTGVTKYNGALVNDVEGFLENYSFSPEYVADSFYSWHDLRYDISEDGCPIYANCQYTMITGHAVVIRGFYVNQNSSATGWGSISYMDPSNGLYASSSVTSDYFYYVPRGTIGESYAMRDFLVVYD